MTIAVRDISMAFGPQQVLDGVSLEVGAGERFAIMGPSGAGKSTLLRIIAGLEPSATGTVGINGRDVTGLPPHERSVGLMFQDLALFPHLTVAENIAFGLRMAGRASASRTARVDELLDVVDLPDHADRPITALSGGERQRVALARTLAPEPSVILFDEPLGSLDQALKDDLLTQMRDIVEGLGTTALYVTHDRTEAEGFADRMAVMRDGHILRADTPEAMWSDPRTSFIAQFMGHTNIVPGAMVGNPAELVAIREDALTLDPAGALTGTVTSCLFRDGRYRTALRIGAGVIVHLVTDTAVAPGEVIGLAIGPAGIMAVEDDA
jgi:ABC-type Fe3+/spermidine/putrescine transport system ATPase subunit